MSIQLWKKSYELWIAHIVSKAKVYLLRSARPRLAMGQSASVAILLGRAYHSKGEIVHIGWSTGSLLAARLAASQLLLSTIRGGLLETSCSIKSSLIPCDHN
jgi:hypothetical protein